MRQLGRTQTKQVVLLTEVELSDIDAGEASTGMQPQQ